MNFSRQAEQSNLTTSRDESCKIFDAFLKAGGNFIDTSNNYVWGESEALIGELVASQRDRFVIATKYTSETRRGDPNASGNHRKNMFHSLEASLKRLNTDYVDLYWVHAWDSRTPVEEVMRALDDLVHSGKVLYVGVSDSPAWIVSQANTLAYCRGWTPYVGLQVEYSLLQRDIERELLPMAVALDLTVAAWAPLAGGILTGKYNDRQPGIKEGGLLRFDPTRIEPLNLRVAEVVRQVSIEINASPSQVALNWLRQREIGNIIPIVGARTCSQMNQNLSCLNFELAPEHLARLERACPIKLGFPHDFLADEEVKRLFKGSDFDIM